MTEPRSDLYPRRDPLAGAEIDADSGALRVAVYDEIGSPIHPCVWGAFVVPIAVRLTDPLPAGSVVWAMAVPAEAPRIGYVRRLRLISGFDRRVSLDGSYWFEILRFRGGPFAGGQAVGIARRDPAYPDSLMAAVRYSGGKAALAPATGTAAPAFDPPHYQRIGARTNASVEHDVIDYGESPWDQFVVPAGHGIAIRLVEAGAVGDFFSGAIAWEARDPPSPAARATGAR